MDTLSGTLYYKDQRLPCSKIEAICLSKDESIKREFFIDTKNEVWGYFDKIGLSHKVYLSEKAFDKIKNCNLKSNGN